MSSGEMPSAQAAAMTTAVALRPRRMAFAPRLAGRRALTLFRLALPDFRDALRQLLEFEGYEVRGASSGAEALATYEAWKPELVFMDVKMSGMDGLETLKRLRARDPSAIVVMISGHATIQNAVEATQLGAYDILEKPLDTDRILVTLRNAIGRIELTQENQRLKATIESRYEIVGRSAAIRAVIEKIDKVAQTTARVLITGENGTGKELVARAVHRQSPRNGERFVEVNCAAIPGELIESELFGHMKGSFTGAVADRAGKFEQADGGTLFLDEIGDMSLTAQAKVLRVLQDGEVTRIGGQKPRRVDVRVLAATNKTLEEEIAAGRFREDLYYRLNVVSLDLPSLADRREDIVPLAQHFLAVVSTRYGKDVKLCRSTDATLLLKAVSEGHVYYDPGIKLDRATSKTHRRSQFRIKFKQVGRLYRQSEDKDVTLVD